MKWTKNTVQALLMLKITTVGKFDKFINLKG